MQLKKGYYFNIFLGSIFIRKILICVDYGGMKAAERNAQRTIEELYPKKHKLLTIIFDYKI